MERHKLSKSTYIRGLQCPKSLYLHKKRPFLRDKLSAEQRAKFSRGHNIGTLAHQLFPAGVNMAPKSPSQYPKAVQNTAQAIKDNTEVIYEATFQHNKTLIMLDILTHKGGKLYGYEVKSSIKISDTYINDAALQYWVITNSGTPLEDFFLVTVNPEYRHKKPFVAEDYFVFTSVLEQILPLQKQIEDRTTSFVKLFDEAHSPKKNIGLQCYNPYPCDFIGFCWKRVPEQSVFNLMHLDDITKFHYYHRGLKTPESIENKISDNALLSKEIMLIKNNTLHIDKTLQDTFNNNPALLFSGITRLAFPLFDNSRPYDEVIFFAAYRKGEKQELRIFKTPQEGEKFVQEIFKKNDNVISFAPLPESLSCRSATIILDEKKEGNLFIPELSGLNSIDKIILRLNPKILQKPYSDIHTAAGAWEKLIKNEDEMQEDIVDGLERYAASGLEVLHQITKK